jgi:hypothetical protein
MNKNIPTPTNREERREFARQLAQALAKKIANDDYLTQETMP